MSEGVIFATVRGRWSDCQDYRSGGRPPRLFLPVRREQGGTRWTPDLPRPDPVVLAVYDHAGERVQRCKALHILEDWGFRTYVVLVCDGTVSIVRLGVTLEGHKSQDELASALDEQLSHFKRRLDALDPAQQRDFAAQVDETLDPYLLIDRIADR